MKEFLQIHSHILQNSDEILCISKRLEGKNLLFVSHEEFCENPAVEMLKITLSSCSGGFVLLLLVEMFVYRFRIKFHAVLNIHRFDRDECIEEPMEYDVYLCFAQDDSPFARRLLDHLKYRGYKVCYHLQDFVIGEEISTNICGAARTTVNLTQIEKCYVPNDAEMRT